MLELAESAYGHGCTHFSVLDLVTFQLGVQGCSISLRVVPERGPPGRFKAQGVKSSERGLMFSVWGSRLLELAEGAHGHGGARRPGVGFRVQGSGFRAQGSEFRVQGSGLRVQGSEFRVQGSGFRVQGSGFRVQSSGFGARL